MDAPLGIKQAALVLHGLAPADCDWMLAQLPEHQHQALRQALQELQALGIPRDAALTQSAAAAANPPALAVDPDHEALARATADAIARTLQGQPQAVVRAVLQLQAGEWHDAVRQCFGIAAGFDEPTARLGPAFRASLASAVAGRLPRDEVKGVSVLGVRTARRRGSRLERWIRNVVLRRAA